MLCLAIGPDGSVYAGSDGEGLIYRVRPDGKATILFDAPQAEVRRCSGPATERFMRARRPKPAAASPARGLAVSDSGGRRAAIPGRAGLDRGPGAALSGRRRPGRFGGRSASKRAVSAPGRPPGTRPARRGLGVTTSRSRPAITPSTDSMPTACRARSCGSRRWSTPWPGPTIACWSAPAPRASFTRFATAAKRPSPIAKLDSGQILSLLVQPDGTILMGTGDPGSVVRLASGYAAAGTLVSEVHDTKLVSRFGSLSWRADLPPGTSVSFETRTGNVGEPDETWSAWSASQSDPSTGTTASPPAGSSSTGEASHRPTPGRRPSCARSRLSYRTSNLAPEITRLDVPDLSTADGAARQTRLNLRWDATDPNDDDLSFTLKVRKEGWPEWIELTDEPITEKTFAWDTTAFPSGIYRVKLTRQRSTVQQPRRRPDARPRKRRIHRRPRRAHREADPAENAARRSC